MRRHERLLSGAPLRIGITIGLHAPDESLWVNGIKQNALFLAKLFQHSLRRHTVRLVNTTDVDISSALPWDLKTYRTLSFADVKDDLDILVELGGQISSEQTAYLKAQGTRIISYCCGAEYVQNMQAIIFNRHINASPFINQGYDALWVVPQNVGTSLHFFQTLRRCPALEVPFVWDPMCLDTRTRELPNEGLCLHTDAAKRLSVLEPNMDVLKFCLYPILIAETAFRRAPQSIAFLHVANTERFVHDDKEFAGLMRTLDIVKAHKAAFIGRVDCPDFLAQNTDIVIAHQWGLPLNYAYLEVAWQGYPLVHNADLIRELGYFYPANDVEAGADALELAMQITSGQTVDFRANQREMISRWFLASNPELVSHYDRLLDEVVAQEMRV